LACGLYDTPDRFSRGGEQHVVIGYGTKSGRGEGQITQGARGMLTQQVRAPQAGQYTFSVHAAAGGTSAEYYRDVFSKHFVCRLKIFGYADDSKSPRNIREYASVVFQPPFAPSGAPKYERFEVTRFLRSQDGGAFELSLGIGVAVVVEKVTPGVLNLAEAAIAHQVFIRLDDVQLDFNARPRNENVRV